VRVTAAPSSPRTSPSRSGSVRQHRELGLVASVVLVFSGGVVGPCVYFGFGRFVGSVLWHPRRGVRSAELGWEGQGGECVWGRANRNTPGPRARGGSLQLPNQRIAGLRLPEASATRATKPPGWDRRPPPALDVRRESERVLFVGPLPACFRPDVAGPAPSLAGRPAHQGLAEISCAVAAGPDFFAGLLAIGESRRWSGIDEE